VPVKLKISAKSTTRNGALVSHDFWTAFQTALVDIECQRKLLMRKVLNLVVVELVPEHSKCEGIIITSTICATVKLILST